MCVCVCVCLVASLDAVSTKAEEVCVGVCVFFFGCVFVFVCLLCLIAFVCLCVCGCVCLCRSLHVGVSGVCVRVSL